MSPNVIVEEKIEQTLKKKSSAPPPGLPSSPTYGMLPSPSSMMPAMLISTPTSPTEKTFGMTSLKEQISPKPDQKQEQKLDKKQKKEKKEKEKAEQKEKEKAEKEKRKVT